MWGNVAFNHQMHPSMVKTHLKCSRAAGFVIVDRTGTELCLITAILVILPPGVTKRFTSGQRKGKLSSEV